MYTESKHNFVSSYSTIFEAFSPRSYSRKWYSVNSNWLVSNIVSVHAIRSTDQCTKTRQSTFADNQPESTCITPIKSSLSDEFQ